MLLSYVNVKIAELDGGRQELLARIAELTVEAIGKEQVSQISGCLGTWDSVSFDDKRRMVVTCRGLHEIFSHECRKKSLNITIYGI